MSANTPLLEGRVAPSPAGEIQRLQKINEQLSEALRHERNKNAAIEAGARELRLVLRPLFDAMKRIYGELDMMGIPDALDQSPVSAAPANAAFWEKWKQKLGGVQAEIIDVLMGHPGMTTSAVAKAAHCRDSTASTLLTRLKQQNLLEKRGNTWVLKSL